MDALIQKTKQKETDPVFIAHPAYGLTSEDMIDIGNLSGTNTGDNANLTETLTAGENLTAGDICYLKSDGKYWKAKGDAKATTAGTLRMALASISADATGSFLKRGVWTTSGLTAGATYFISTSTAGAKTTTTPTTGNFIRVVGVAQSSTIFEFEPSKDYGEVA